eukprot:scaffold2222_cov188-Prasinococcus_capsulatus_cf.AAC.1
MVRVSPRACHARHACCRGAGAVWTDAWFVSTISRSERGRGAATCERHAREEDDADARAQAHARAGSSQHPLAAARGVRLLALHPLELAVLGVE